MSNAYNSYLREHIENVKRAWEWLDSHFPDIRNKMGKNYVWIFDKHDGSKYSDDEYGAYDKYFYGKNRSYKVVKDFDYAWLHHIHNNQHHWQYWILQRDDGTEEILDMPYWYIIEMICDWWSFSWKSGKLDEIFDWYDKHKDGMKLSKKTRSEVEKILDMIRKELNEDNEYLEHHGIKGQKWGVLNGPPYPLNSQLKNKTPAKIEAIKNYNGKLYFISETDMDGKTLQPRIPKNFFTENDYEDASTPRVCFAQSVDGCLKGLSQNLKGKSFYVFEPEQLPETVYKPNKGAVPDSEITTEMWVKEPVKLKKTGKIFVNGDDGNDGIPFEYGDHKAELYGWNYDWEETSDNSYMQKEENDAKERMKTIHHPTGDLAKKDLVDGDPHPLEDFGDLKKLPNDVNMDDIRRGINHPGKKGEDDLGRTYNCPKCACAFEMTERGYDVQARPSKNGSNVGDIERYFDGGKLKLFDSGDSIDKMKKAAADYANASIEERKAKYDKLYDDALKEAYDKFDNKLKQEENGSRGIIVVGWIMDEMDLSKRTTCYHAMNYKVEDGKVMYYDPQSYRMSTGSNKVNDAIYGADVRELYSMRTDNLELNPSITQMVYSRRGEAA